MEQSGGFTGTREAPPLAASEADADTSVHAATSHTNALTSSRRSPGTQKNIPATAGAALSSSSRLEDTDAGTSAPGDDEASQQSMVSTMESSSSRHSRIPGGFVGDSSDRATGANGGVGGRNGGIFSQLSDGVYVCSHGPDELPGLRAWVLVSEQSVSAAHVSPSSL